MAEVQENNNSSSRIKLFGATISLKEESNDPAEDPDQINDDQEPKKDNNQTAEKRPDKIIPCPRCKSMETKFCYFNNYNVNQPRHFCKGCQRYWTAGGALRNVPVGAGRRKTKPPCGGLTALSEGCLFDASGMQRLEYFEEVVEESAWQVAEHGGFQHLFPAKRRRCASNSQSY